MLQITSLDENKTDWMNETPLIIPMEDLQSKDMDDISKNTISLNTLEGTEHSLLTNVAGQTFVIGLDRNIFDNYDSKTDLLLMQNADLKQLPTVPDSKLTFSLSSVDPVIEPKSEIVWEHTSFEKPIPKDILNVIQESSKNWGDLGKNSDMCLEDMGSVSDSKLSSDFLLEADLISKSKKVKQEAGDEQYVVGYYPIVETCDAVLVPASLMTTPQKTVDSLKAQKAIVLENDIIINAKNLNHLLVNESVDDSQSVKWVKSGMNSISDVNNKTSSSILQINGLQEKSQILAHEDADKLNDPPMPVLHSAINQFIISKSSDGAIYSDLEKCLSKSENKNEKFLGNESNILREQSLPLKKKAKMKKSPAGTCEINDRPLLVSNRNESLKYCYNDVDGSVSKHIRKKSENTTCNFKKKRKICDESRMPKMDSREESTDKVQYLEKELIREVNSKGGNIRSNCQPFKSVLDLLDHLKSEKYISDSISKILLAGLQEMQVDVLKEMYSKKDSSCPKEYSCQLKAFALMLYFKQRNAFNRLEELFGNGWPSINIIKDWKRRLNNHRRPNTNLSEDEPSQGS